MSVNHLIKRPSLGRRAALGQLYDARNENFNEKNLFNKDLNSGLLVFNEKDLIEIEANRIENQLDRFKSLKIDGEPMLSVLAGLIELAGTAKYLRGGAVNEKTLSYNIVENVLTLSEKIKWEEREILSYISEKDLEDEAVTHVVLGIEWGSSVIVSLDVDISQASDPSIADEKIWSQLQSVIHSLKEGRMAVDEVVLEEQIRLQAYADDGSVSILSSFDEALALLQEAAKPWHGRSKKRRIPITYELLDVRNLVKRFKIPVEISTSYKRIPKGQVERLSKLLVDANQQSALLVELETLAAQAVTAISRVDSEAFRDYCLVCIENFETLQQEAKRLLPLARNDDEDSLDEIDHLASGNVNEWATPKGVEAFDQRFGSMIRTIEFFNHMAEYEITFVRDEAGYHRLKDECDGKFLALFYTLEKNRDQQYWKRVMEQFKKLAKAKETMDIYVAVNIDDLPHLQVQEGLPAGMRIVKAEGKAYVLTDVSEHLELIEQTNYVITDGDVQPSTKQSLDLVRASIPCPNASCCSESREGKTWICKICNKPLEYGFDDKFYCDCGMGEVGNYSFHCSSNLHGDDFLAYDPSQLQETLATLKPYEKINILVIGQTGIGKSTWINAIATYITHETLEVAAADEFTHLIPFRFTTTTVTGQGNEVSEIKIGADSSNEIYREKMSVTQYPKAHHFKNNDQRRVYCIVDTPGVGDCQGIENDKRNMQNIVNFIGKLGHLNLICFLLPPNTARLDPTFEFCFKELIMQFHRSAIDNIAFCFTNASGCGFRIGETIVPLRQLIDEIKEKQGIEIVLNDKRLFIFDNIAYRYLAWLHIKGIPESDREVLDLITRSYDFSAKATKRMLKQAYLTPPHEIKETIHLNYARRVIIGMAKPLATIATKVGQTVAEIWTTQNESTRFQGQASEMLLVLMKKVTFYRYTIRLDRKIYCKHCIVWKIYEGVERDKLIETNPSLAERNPLTLFDGRPIEMIDGKYKCEKHGFDFPQIPSGNCYPKIYEEKEEIDEEVQQKLNHAKTDVQRCEILLKQKQKLRDELEWEMQQIQKASAKFAIFLKNNSITTYNDITEQYLLQLMDLEKDAGRVRGEKYQALTRMLEVHKAEIKIITDRLTQATQNGSAGKIEADEVLIAVDELKSLKHNGKNIRETLSAVKKWVAADEDQEPSSVYTLPQPESRDPGCFGKLSRFFGRRDDRLDPPLAIEYHEDN